MKTAGCLAVSVLSWMVAVALPASDAASKVSEPRHYSEDGLEFDYDPRLTLETEKKDLTSTINLKLGKGGSDLVITIQIVEPVTLSGEAYAAAVLQGLRTGMEKGGADVEEIQAVKTTIGKEERTGQRFNYKLLTAELTYQAYGWDLSTGNPNRRIQFVAIQYQRKREEKVKPMVETTLRSLQYKKP